MEFISTGIKYYAEIEEENNIYYQEIDTLDICNFTYQDGMISVGFLTAFEALYNNQVIRGVIHPVTKRYYFGEFLSLNTLLNHNQNHEYDEMIKKLEERQLLNFIGYVKDTNGNYHMIMKQDVVISKPIKQKTR